MNNMAFVIWMVMWPLVNTLSAYVYEYKLKRVYTDKDRGYSCVLELVIWIVIGKLLYGE